MAHDLRVEPLMGIQWHKVPVIRNGKRSKYSLDPTYTGCTVRLPRDLIAQLRAVSSQLRKDRKLIHFKTTPQPMQASVSALIVKAIELMIFPDDKGDKNDQG